MEAMVKGQQERKDHFPRFITCPNEMVALSMADGYARCTSKPQCVIVHVDVGTQGLGAAVHNASCGRAPVLIFAGLSPCTLEGELRGSRTEYIHWMQDVPDQKQIVAQYCRYVGELKTGRNVKQIVNRALQFATSAPMGPVYLMATREVLEEELDPYSLEQAHWGAVAPSALTEDAVARIAEALVSAKEPLIITGYSGRNHSTVAELVKLAETIKGIRVLDTGGSDVCFPADHWASLGFKFGVDDSIQTADVILVVDCDVPWIPTQCRPRKETRIFHIDVDPLKQQMPVFYIPAEGRYKADSHTAIKQLHLFIHSHASLREQADSYEDRRNALQEAYDRRLNRFHAIAEPAADGTIEVSYLAAAIRKAVPIDTIFVIEAVSNSIPIAEQIRASIPGSWLNCGGGGLGWSGGGALGIKLAVGEKKFVCQIVGDGTFLFSVPGSVYWISRRYNLPVLTIVLNNGGWTAPRKSLLLVHPSGLGSRVSNNELNISFGPYTPDYAGIARAAAGGGEGGGERREGGGRVRRERVGWEGELWAEKASSVSELEKKLPLAVQAVLGGRAAVLDAQLGGGGGIR